MKKKLFILFSCLVLGFWLKAQSTERSHISASAAESYGSSMTLQWTVGELAATTRINDDLMLTEGFLQPTVQILKVPNYRSYSDDDLLTENVKIELWPSPVTSNLNIQLRGNATKGVSLNLFDMSGKRLITKNLDSEIETNTLNLDTKVPGEYILKFTTQDGSHLQSFIIIKI